MIYDIGVTGFNLDLLKIIAFCFFSKENRYKKNKTSFAIAVFLTTIHVYRGSLLAPDVSKIFTLTSSTKRFVFGKSNFVQLVCVSQTYFASVLDKAARAKFQNEKL